MILSTNIFWIIYISLLIFNLFFINFFERKLRCPIKYQVFSVILGTVPLIINKDLTLNAFVFTLLFEVLLIYAFIDIKFFELSNWHYLIVIFYALFGFVLSFLSHEYLLHLVSFFIMYATFFVFDKFVGIEKLGGADVKVMLSIALFFSAVDVLYFILMVFLISGIIFIIERIVRKSFCDLQVPMIVSIAIAFYLTEFRYFFI